jgi:ABC-2 type transport system ATP-binding protein
MEVIRLDDVSLWRRTQEEFSYDLKKTVLALAEGRYRKPAKRLVLDRLDLVVNAGEKVGIIGANGSGKSTLLKVICNILEPTSGQVRVRGNIAPLIELGAGFDADMSVADNIILYGVILGFSEQEMRQRMGEILDFAELQEYATMPVKALSSGMVARLGFAIATDIQPDILILDEVLSVGDESFRNKCKRRIDQFWQDHTTILLVSHDLDFLQKSCERVVWLERGKIKQVGASLEVVQAYLDSVHALALKDKKPAKRSSDPPPDQEHPVDNGLPIADVQGCVSLIKLFLTDENKQPVSDVEFGKPFYVAIQYRVDVVLKELRLGFYVIDMADRLLLEPASNNWLPTTGEICELGEHCIYAMLPGPLLTPGRYIISRVGAYEEGFGHHLLKIGEIMTFQVYLPPEAKNEWFGREIVHPAIEWTFE